MQHLIRTQIIEVVTDRPAEAFDLQHAMSALYYRSILPLLEKAFDELAPGDRTIQLDRVEIDLGIMTLEEIEKKDWPVKFRDILYRQLKEVLLVSQLTATSPSPIYSIAGQWLFYMKKGYLPWNVRETTAEWYKKVLETLASDYRSIELLRTLIRDDARAVTRIAFLHERGYLTHLAEVLTARNQGGLLQVILSIRQSLSITNEITDTTEWQRFERQLWQRILPFVASVSRQAADREIIEEIILPALDTAKLRQLADAKGVPVILNEFMPLVKELLRKKEAGKEDQPITESRNEPVKGEKAGIPEEGLFISHAGMVILHPFLRSFFAATGLTAGGIFKGKDEQVKAIHLLHYLVSGETKFEEHELVIHKILCGYALGEPVEPVDITGAEITEADRLLQAVIAEWSILQNTSATALRESFLQRNGKLVLSKNNDMRLMIESHALDVLLDHLPWGMSMIKLPWMPQLLKVEWKK